jgi:hypothetical protein
LYTNPVLVALAKSNCHERGDQMSITITVPREMETKLQHKAMTQRLHEN